MERKLFYVIAAAGFVLAAVVGTMSSAGWWILAFAVLWTAVGLYDLYMSKQNILINYPVIGHLRYAMEFISPEIRQYFIESNEDGKPYSRIQRNLVTARAEGLPDTQPFGTQLEDMAAGFIRADHSLAPKSVDPSHARVMVGGPACTQPYSASRINISAMSFGALSSNAIHALNAGARRGGFAHNTGEGGLSPYHLAGGGDIVWQIGTGYFGCRTEEGGFAPELFAKNATLPVVKMIEIKLSQGAKPAHGGVLPAAKVDAEIARIRGVAVGKDVLSPPAHSVFSTPTGLLEFVQQLRDLSGGKPVGFKLSVGRREEFAGICKAMIETGILPDFITVDGAEGGTGAAPLEFTDRLGRPIDEALSFVHDCLVGIGKRDQIRVIASGKVITGFDVVEKLALGADMCNLARPMLFAIGCIQAVRCNSNTCPSGVATQDRNRSRAVDIELRQTHVAQFHKATMEAFLDLVGAMGMTSPEELSRRDIFRRIRGGDVEQTWSNTFPDVMPGSFLGADIPDAYKAIWAASAPDRFSSRVPVAAKA
ncbi:MAG: FMN-binding glutamate synthase family protein [Pseudomonadota bacterium]